VLDPQDVLVFDILIQISSGSIFHRYSQVIVGDEHLSEPDDMGMHLRSKSELSICPQQNNMYAIMVQLSLDFPA
jgi:hypothetical protein